MQSPWCFNRTSENGSQWASSSESFYLREYIAAIAQEDGTDKEETVNEASSILKFIKGSAASHGLRLNGGRKQQVIQKFPDEETGQMCIFGKIPQGMLFSSSGVDCEWVIS